MLPQGAHPGSAGLANPYLVDVPTDLFSGLFRMFMSDTNKEASLQKELKGVQSAWDTYHSQNLKLANWLEERKNKSSPSYHLKQERRAKVVTKMNSLKRREKELEAQIHALQNKSTVHTPSHR